MTEIQSLTQQVLRAFFLISCLLGVGMMVFGNLTSAVLCVNTDATLALRQQAASMGQGDSYFG